MVSQLLLILSISLLDSIWNFINLKVIISRLRLLFTSAFLDKITRSRGEAEVHEVRIEAARKKTVVSWNYSTSSSVAHVNEWMNIHYMYYWLQITSTEPDIWPHCLLVQLLFVFISTLHLIYCTSNSILLTFPILQLHLATFYSLSVLSSCFLANLSQLPLYF
jgi:hypothetical protein